MATAELTEHNLDEWTISLGGAIFDSFGASTVLSITQEPIYTKVVSGDGRVTRSKTLDRSATISITVMSSSMANDFMTALANVDMLGKNGAGVVPFLAVDGSGRAVYEASKAWISGWPDIEVGREAAEYTWTIEASKLVRYDGGSRGL